MRLVGFSSGTGYLCQRDTLGRMRGFLGERRSGMGGWFSDLPKQISAATGGAASGAATGASAGIMAGPIGSAAGSILGTLFGAGTSIWVANKQAEASSKQANYEAAKALRDAGALAQQQAFAASQKKVEMQALTKTVVISAVAIGGLALAGLIVYRMAKK
jgi:hypothetical protein